MEIVDGPLAGLLARAVVVIDENGKVIHAELVPSKKFPGLFPVGRLDMDTTGAHEEI